ncbi:MAG TPA: DUF4124 domain-containing protein [Burkholderiaceae bacterium]
MTRHLLALTTFCSGLLAALPSAAQEVYLCIDSQGRKEYKNNGATKGCKRVELPSMTTFPAPRPQTQPAKAGAKPASGNASAPAASPAASDPSFPRVDTATQKSRDSDRRQILQDELRAETLKLETMRKEFNNGEPERRGDERNYAKYQERVEQMRTDLNRVQANVDALRREVGNLR